MKTIYLFAILAILLLPATGRSQTEWKPTSYSVTFKIKNAGISVNGSFDTVSAVLLFSQEKLSTSSLSGKVVVNSIHTGINMRDKDIKKEEYFDVDKFKDIEIKSTKVYYKGNAYAGLFDVTIKGVTRQIEIPFDFIQLSDEGEFKGSFTINRRDFGVGGGSMMMGDNVTITIDIKAKK